METKNAKKSTTKKTSTTSSKSTPKTPAKKDAAKDLKDLFEDSLKDIYWAEKALAKALPKMQKKRHSPKVEKSNRRSFGRDKRACKET